MRDLDALLTSLVNIDRNSLIAILASEADVAECLAKSLRQRTAAQRAKRREAIERADRIGRILLFVRTGETGPEFSEADVILCKSIEERLRARIQRESVAEKL